MEAWREELYHGREWKHHKYLRKEGNRYIYENDQRKSDHQNNTNEKDLVSVSVKMLY